MKGNPVKSTGWGICSYSWVVFDLICPPSSPAAQPVLPISHQPKQNQAVRLEQTKSKSTQPSYPSRCPFLFGILPYFIAWPYPESVALTCPISWQFMVQTSMKWRSRLTEWAKHFCIFRNPDFINVILCTTRLCMTCPPLGPRTLRNIRRASDIVAGT